MLRSITLEYVVPLPAGYGVFDHPSHPGKSCALCVSNIAEWHEDQQEDMISYVRAVLLDPEVHSVIIEGEE